MKILFKVKLIYIYIYYFIIKLLIFCQCDLNNVDRVKVFFFFYVSFIIEFSQICNPQPTDIRYASSERNIIN